MRALSANVARQQILYLRWAVEDGKDVAARAARKKVPGAAAGNGVAAFTPFEPVGAGAAGKDVVAATTEEGVAHRGSTCRCRRPRR